MIGVFDCCRETWVNPSFTRGSGDGADGDPDLVVGNADLENTILIFGCAPGKEVAAVSTVATEFIQQLQNSI